MYAGVPPPAVTAAVPVFPPLHKILVDAEMVAVNKGGCVIVTVAVAEHPVASFTVTVYVPALRPVPIAFVPPVGAHDYVYGAVPPVALAVAVPVEPPLHSTPVLPVILAVTAEGCVTVTVAVSVHPLWSVTTTV